LDFRENSTENPIFRTNFKTEVTARLGIRKKMLCHLFLSKPDSAAISGKAFPGAETIGECNGSDSEHERKKRPFRAS